MPLFMQGVIGLSARDASAIESTGTIEATTVNLSAKTQGTLESIAVKAGETVSEGQQVAELPRKDLAAQRERDALTVLKAEAALADLVSGAREQEIKQVLLADLVITSPLDGRVLSVNYEVGEFVTPGAPVATIADLSDMTTCPTSKWVRRSPVP